MSALQTRDVLTAEVLAMEPLSAAELAEFESHERYLAKHLKDWHGCNGALLAIHDKRLYRHRWATFADYLEDHWLMSRTQAYRLIAFERLVGQLPSDLPRPSNETKTRPLAKLAPDTRDAAYREAVASAGGSEPTTRQVKEAVARVAPETLSDWEVRRARESGIIGPDAAVEVTEPTPDPEAVSPRGDTEPDAPTDDEWLESLPARARLAAHIRDRFDADALHFRACHAAVDTFRNATRPLTKAAKRATPGHEGRYADRLNYFLRTEGPERWVACEDCGGTGHVPLIGACVPCRGHGYHL